MLTFLPTLYYSTKRIRLLELIFISHSDPYINNAEVRQVKQPRALVLTKALTMHCVLQVK